MGGPILSEKEVETKIAKFIDRKAAKFPELELRPQAAPVHERSPKSYLDALQSLFVELTIEVPRTRRQRAHS